jgi:GT2 family glycosyltransferase
VSPPEVERRAGVGGGPQIESDTAPPAAGAQAEPATAPPAAAPQADPANGPVAAGPQIESDTAPPAAVQAAPRIPVAVCIVTHNSAPDLADCMAAIAALRPRPIEVALVDSGSADGSLEAARRAAPPGLPLSLAAQAANVGFAAAMNAAIAATSAPYVLTLNADARPRPDYLARLVARFEAHPGLPVAAVTGRLLRPAGSAATGGSRGRPAGSDFRGVPHVHPGRAAAATGGSRGRPAGSDFRGVPHVHPGRAAAATGGSRGRPAPAPGGGPRLLDACGMQLTRSWRHLDRGSGEPDRGQWALPERVFGATGAATLFRREALLDAAVDGEVFDPRFHSFREDAELCFRLRERGWEVLYEPAAVAEHRRFNLPERRSAMPAEVNFHSLKNRYLLRVYHQTGRNFVRTLLPALGRDLAALAWVLLAERSSLGAYGWLLRHRRELLARRRAIQRRRTVPAAELDRWFGRAGAPL